MEPTYITFENTYIENKSELGDDCPALACTAIDGYPDGEDGQGTVICNVWMLEDHRFLIDWHHNGYRTHETVLALIEDAKKTMLEAY